MKRRINKIYIADTNTGLGVFAKKLIKKDEMILEFSGPIINSGQITGEKAQRGNPLQVGKSKYIDIQKPGVLVNHSCNPNAGIKNDINLIAIRNINKNEEIRYDYSATMDESDWAMKCECGSKNCRKIIKDFKYLPRNTQKKYLKLNIVQKFIARKYKKKI